MWVTKQVCIYTNSGKPKLLHKGMCTLQVPLMTEALCGRLRHQGVRVWYYIRRSPLQGEIR